MLKLNIHTIIRVVAKIHVELDKANQIIVQKIQGKMDERAAQKIYKMTDLCVRQLANRNDIRILADMSLSTEATPKARKMLGGFAQDKKVNKLAIFGGGMVMTVMTKFIHIVFKLDKVKAFNSEEKARNWLVS